jgi:hypothetical protein
VLAKHSKSFSLIDCISVGVDRMQRNFEPMGKQVEAWQRSELTVVTAKVVIYEAFVEGKLEAPKHLARTVHDPVLRAEVRGIPGRGQSGVSRMHSLRRSRNWSPFHSLRRQPSWASTWKPGSRSRSSPRGGAAGRRSIPFQQEIELDYEEPRAGEFCLAGAKQKESLSWLHCSGDSLV